MARYNLTFRLHDTSTDDMLRALDDALVGNLATTKAVGGTVEGPLFFPAENSASQSTEGEAEGSAPEAPAESLISKQNQ
jgi:hypothetical protein